VINCTVLLHFHPHIDSFSALTLLVGRHPACKTLEWWGAGMVICLERGADLHTAQLMPVPLTVSCFSKIQIGFTFLVQVHLGSPGQRAVKWACVLTPLLSTPALFNCAIFELFHSVLGFPTFPLFFLIISTAEFSVVDWLHGFVFERQ